MIHILGLRPWFNPKKQKWEKTEAFFENNWRAESVPAIFADPEAHLKNVPLEERVNLYFTVALCHDGRGRKLKEQWTIPFDIDHVPEDKARDVLFRATQALGLTTEEVGSLYSGHGVQFFVQLDTKIEGEDYFESARPHYRALCDRIQSALKAYGLPGDVDVSVWSPARLMRMPNTINDKADKGLAPAKAYVLTSHMPPLSFSLEERSGLPRIAASEQIAPAFLAKYPEIDVDAVEKGCEFLKWAKANQNDVREFQWYALLSIVGRFPDGEKFAHAYSREHKGYSPHETKAKLEQALQASGPRTCKNVDGLWEGCKKCPNYNKVASPIVIQGPDYIKTASTGFHDVGIAQDGSPKVGKPNVHDLWKYFRKQHQYITVEESQEVYVYNGTHWVPMIEPRLLHFAETKFNPPVGASVRNEFLQKIIINNLQPYSWFGRSTHRKINFKNGTLDLGTMRLEPHSPEHGFRYVLDYDYNPEAECPRFDQFMDEITLGREEFKTLLLEFGGYAFSGDECWAEAALFMTGKGSNGKSTYMNVLKSLAGEKTFATVSMRELQEPTRRAELDGALFNISSETSVRSLHESDFFKAAVSGENISVKKLYVQPYTIPNRAKFILSCNELPITNDNTHAFFRRMIIVPFEARFDLGKTADVKLKDVLRGERAGIMNRFLQAYVRAKKFGTFSRTERTQELIIKYAESMDTVGTWFIDNYEMLPVQATNHFLAKQAIYQNYLEWARYSSGERPVSSVQFWRRIENYVHDLPQRESRHTVNGRRERTIVGIRAREGEEEF